MALQLEHLEIEGVDMGRKKTGWFADFRRTPVPGGWLVAFCIEDGGSGLTFVPDANHEWDGNSVPVGH